MAKAHARLRVVVARNIWRVGVGRHMIELQETF
jgi:hypothetical protein